MVVIKCAFLFIVGLLGGWKLMDLVVLLFKNIKKGRYVRQYNCVKRDILILEQVATYSVFIKQLIAERDDAHLRNDMITVRNMAHLIEDVIRAKEDCMDKYEKIKKGDAKLDGNSKIRRDD